MGWIGIGAVAVGFLLVNGAATVSQGVGQIVNDVSKSTVMREDNIARTGAESVGRAVRGETGAKVAGGGDMTLPWLLQMFMRVKWSYSKQG